MPRPLDFSAPDYWERWEFRQKAKDRLDNYIRKVYFLKLTLLAFGIGLALVEVWKKNSGQPSIFDSPIEITDITEDQNN